MAGNTPHQGGGDGNAHGGGSKIVKRKAHHLRKIGQGGFAAVTLPIGIGGKTGRRVEGQIGGDRPEALGVQGQQVLKPKNDIGKQQPDQAEQKQGNGIAFQSCSFFGSTRKNR